MLWLHHRTARQDERPLDGVLELSDVSRPRVARELGKRRRSERRVRHAELFRITPDEMRGERSHVFAALTQWRQRNGDDVDAVEEILAEPAVGHLFAEVPIRSRDDPHVDSTRCRRSDCPHLSLLDGIQAARMMQEHSHVPIIFLTGHRDSETLQRAVLTGPLGYLIKPFQEDELRCAIEVAIHKHRAERAVREREEALLRNAELLQTLSLIDELTQLRNRRGFFELAQQALKVAQREHYAMGVFFMDLNGLKRINDTLGHQSGDQALRDTAEVLRATFRSSDILARIGGDEFVAMAHVHSTQDLHALSGRLREHLHEFNKTHRRPYPLNISVGMTLVDIPTEEDLESLLARADAAMYEEKRAVSSRA